MCLFIAPRPFRGLLSDMTRCYNSYRSDFHEAISLQSVAALILIFFANNTVAFTFGAVLSDQTDSTLVSVGVWPVDVVRGGLMWVSSQ